MVAKILLGVLIGGAIGALLGYFGKCSSGTCPLTANPYRGAIYGSLIGALLVSAFSRTTVKQVQESPNIIHISSEADFKTVVLDANSICLVDLFSDRCPPCKALTPIVSSLADKYVGRITVCKVDIDRVPPIAQRYTVVAIPTVVIIENGKEIKRLVGLQSENEYITFLERLVDEGKD